MSNITTRTGDAVAVPTQATLHVVFRVAGSDYLLPSETVLQIESFTEATPVPGAPAFVAGLVQVRGRIVPVVDLGLRFGGPPCDRTENSRVVVGQHGERVVGLLTELAREVVKLAPDQIKPPPPIVQSEAGGFVRGVAQIGPRVLMLVDFASIVGEESLDGVDER